MSIDIGYILSMVTKNISKWMKCDIKKKFSDCIPPLSKDSVSRDILNICKEESNDSELNAKVEKLS